MKVTSISFRSVSSRAATVSEDASTNRQVGREAPFTGYAGTKRKPPMACRSRFKVALMGFASLIAVVSAEAVEAPGGLSLCVEKTQGMDCVSAQVPPQPEPVPPADGSTVLGISGDEFTINGRPTFLLGASYFNGRHWHKSDLDFLAARGFNLIRVWMDWLYESYFDSNGNLAYERDLIDLVRYADQKGIVVDLTILDTATSFGTSFGERTNAVRTAVRALRNENNVLFDIMNEHDHDIGEDFVGVPKKAISHDELTELIRVAKAENPNAIVTVSSLQGHMVEMTDPLDSLQKSNINEELAAGVDLVAPHFHRDPDWGRDTSVRVSMVKNYLASVGKAVPVYVQEDHRRGWTSRTAPVEPVEIDFLTAATGAKRAGAAGWVFHTAAGYELESQDFVSSLDFVEQSVVAKLANQVAGVR